MFGKNFQKLGGLFGDRSTRAAMGLQMMAAPNNQAAFAAMGQGMAFNAQQQKELAERAKKIQYLKSLSNTNPQTVGAVEAGILTPAQAFQSMTRVAGGDTTYGKSPVYGTDPETGQTILGVVGDNGTFKRLETPGFTPSSGLDKIDTGTEIITRDRRTGQTLSVVPKQNEQAAFEKGRGTALGKAQGESASNLGYATNALDETMSLVDSVLTHPSLPDAVGPVDGRLPSFRAGSRDFDERVEQIKNKAFLSARQELKGGGAITDFEGTKAESALLRASQAKSEADFIQAMNEFKEALARGKQLLALQAGQGGAVPQQQTFAAENPVMPDFTNMSDEELEAIVNGR